VKYVVADAITREELPGMPTPMLISLGSGEAYMKDEGIWRAKDDRYNEARTVAALLVEAANKAE